jgi:hypothetical protein
VKKRAVVCCYAKDLPGTNRSSERPRWSHAANSHAPLGKRVQSFLIRQDDHSLEVSEVQLSLAASKPTSRRAFSKIVAPFHPPNRRLTGTRTLAFSFQLEGRS